MAHAWIKGTDGTQYYVNDANGVVAGMYKDAGNGGQIFKVGFGGDFAKLYHTEASARGAIEKMAPAAVLRTQKLGATTLRGASPKNSTKTTRTAARTTSKTKSKTVR